MKKSRFYSNLDISLDTNLDINLDIGPLYEFSGTGCSILNFASSYSLGSFGNRRPTSVQINPKGIDSVTATMVLLEKLLLT